jgi:hypothetical protein
VTEILKRYKSPGSDQIPAELIQESSETLLPQQQKKFIIVPVHKKGDETDCSNYCGTALLLTSYKMLSNILLSRLSPYVDEIIIWPQETLCITNI